MSAPPPWLHGRITKEQADEKLTEGGTVAPGKFLVRKHKEAGKYVLSIGFKGKATHHICSKNDADIYTVNTKDYGGSQKNIAQLIKYLKTKPPGWPVKFADYVPVDGAASPTKPKAAGGSSGTKKKVSGKGSASPGWLHGAINKEAAEELLGKDPNPNKTGRFLVRKKVQKGQYVISICFKGKPTHHMIAKDDQGVFTVNKKQFSDSATKLTSLLEVLAKKPTGWPVALAEFVDPTGKISPYGKDASEPPKPDASGTGTSVKKTFIYPPLAKTKAEELLNSANDGAKKEGTFLFRMKPKSEKLQYVLSVIYKGAPTHHLMTRSKVGDNWTVNKTVCEGITKLKQLATHLKTKKAWWPVPLLHPVMKGGGGGDVKPKKETKAKEDTAETKGTDKAEPNDEPHDDKSEESKKEEPPEPEVEKPPPMVDVNQPVREFVGGSMTDVTITREATANAWGFGIASEWLGIGQGHANVVSNITIGSPAEGALQLHDIIVQIDGHLVESSTLAEVKESMIDTEKVVKLMLFRKRDPRAETAAPDLEPILPPQRSKSAQMYSWWQTKVVVKVKKPDPDGKPAELKPKKQSLECNSLWDPIYHVKEKQERQKMMRRPSSSRLREGDVSDIAMNLTMVEDTMV